MFIGGKLVKAGCRNILYNGFAEAKIMKRVYTILKISQTQLRGLMV
jgi:hypothetical protein